MRLSEAIRKGHTMIGETHDFFLDRSCGCAIGAAWVALGKTFDDRLFMAGADMMRWVSDQTGVPLCVVKEISSRHTAGESRLSLADWVEREYESKLPQKARESDQAYTARVLAEITIGATGVGEICDAEIEPQAK